MKSHRIVATTLAGIESAASRVLEIFSLDGSAAPAFRPKRKRGPKTNYKQVEIEEQLAALPPELKVAAKADLLGCSESTIYRIQRRKKPRLS